MLIAKNVGAEAIAICCRHIIRIATTSSVVHTILIATAMGLVAVTALAVGMWSFIHSDGGELRAEIRQAFATETLVPKSGPLFDMRRGDYLFNDCLILQALLLGRDDWRHSVIDATIYLDGESCQLLLAEVTNQRPSTTTYQYSQYVFAARIVSAPLIVAFGVERTKQLLRLTTYLILLAAALMSAHALAGTTLPRRYPRTHYMAILISAAAMLSLYRLEYYAQTLAHGYSEIVIALFLLHSLTTVEQRHRSGIPIAAIVLGVATGSFELLTGPSLVAVGIAVLVDHCAAPTRAHPYRRAALVALGCIAGILMAMFWQQVLVSTLSDARPFYKFATHLAMRLQLHQFFSIPFEPQWATAANLHLYSPAEVMNAVIGALPNLTYGSAMLAEILFACSAIVIALGFAFAGGGAAWLHNCSCRWPLGSGLVFCVCKSHRAARAMDGSDGGVAADLREHLAHVNDRTGLLDDCARPCLSGRKRPARPYGRASVSAA